MKRSIAVLALAGAMAIAGTAYVAQAQQGLVFQKAQNQGELATVRLAGTTVFNAKAETIGRISDIVLGADGRATTVVITVGGVAGIGGKQVAVPFSALKVGPVVEGSRVLLIDVTKEQLQAAPAYVATDPGRIERARKKASDWAKIAKDKAIELGKQASEAVQGMREKMQQPAPAPSQPAPAPAAK
jgi:sporulation protein YlmC with PRC-barrel domain